jgi:hypothetical protein
MPRILHHIDVVPGYHVNQADLWRGFCQRHLDPVADCGAAGAIIGNPWGRTNGNMEFTGWLQAEPWLRQDFVAALKAFRSRQLAKGRPWETIIYLGKFPADALLSKQTPDTFAYHRLIEDSLYPVLSIPGASLAIDGGSMMPPSHAASWVARHLESKRRKVYGEPWPHKGATEWHRRGVIVIDSHEATQNPSKNPASATWAAQPEQLTGERIILLPMLDETTDWPARFKAVLARGHSAAGDVGRLIGAGVKIEELN